MVVEKEEEEEEDEEEGKGRGRGRGRKRRRKRKKQEEEEEETGRGEEEEEEKAVAGEKGSQPWEGALWARTKPPPVAWAPSLAEREPGASASLLTKQLPS